MLSINNTLQKIEKGLSIISWVATILITFVIITDIFLRFLFNKPIPGSWEFSEVIMPYIVLFALAYTLEKDGHVRMRLVTNLLSSKFQFGCEIFSNIVSAVFCVIVTYISWLYFWDSFIIREEMLAAIKIPWWLGKFAMPVGMATLSARYIMQLINLLHRHRQL